MRPTASMGEAAAKPLSKRARRRAEVARLLQQQPALSDRQIAHLVGCDRRTVATDRAHLEQSGAVPPSTRTRRVRRADGERTTAPLTAPAAPGQVADRNDGARTAGAACRSPIGAGGSTRSGYSSPPRGGVVERGLAKRGPHTAKDSLRSDLVLAQAYLSLGLAEGGADPRVRFLLQKVLRQLRRIKAMVDDRGGT